VAKNRLVISQNHTQPQWSVRKSLRALFVLSWHQSDPSLFPAPSDIVSALLYRAYRLNDPWTVQAPGGNPV
jgi:hypothetical protein